MGTLRYCLRRRVMSYIFWRLLRYGISRAVNCLYEQQEFLGFRYLDLFTFDCQIWRLFHYFVCCIFRSQEHSFRFWSILFHVIVITPVGRLGWKCARCHHLQIRLEGIYMSRLVTKPTKRHVRPAKTRVSLGIRPVWSEPLLSAWRKLGPLATHWVHSEDFDQTGWMSRLIWVLAGRTATFLVLSRGGSCLTQTKSGFLDLEFAAFSHVMFHMDYWLRM